MSSHPHAMGTMELGLQRGLCQDGKKTPLPLLQTLLCWKQLLGKVLGQDKISIPGVLARPSLPGEPDGGSLAGAEPGTCPCPGSRHVAQRLRRVPDAQRVTERLLFPAGESGAGACRCTNHSPRGLAALAALPLQRPGRKPVVSSWHRAQAHPCGAPEPPPPQLLQPGLQGLLLRPCRRGAGRLPSLVMPL